MHVNTQDVLIAICSLHTFHALHWTTPKAKPPNQTHAVAARLSHYSLRISYAAWHALHCRIHTALHNSKSTVRTFHSTLDTFHSTLHTLHSTPHGLLLKKMRPTLPSTTSYCKACTKCLPVLFYSTSLAQSTSQYYFVHLCATKAPSSTTVYYKHLQALHKVIPSTTLYYQACTKHFPILLLCITKPAQSTSQSEMSLKWLGNESETGLKATSHYKACTKYFPVLLRTTSVAETIS